MRIQRVVDYFVYLAVRVLICVIQALRIETCHALARGLAVLFADVIRLRRKVIDENLRHAYPEQSEEERRRMARQMWEHLFLFVVEVAHLPRKIHETNWRDYVELHRARDLVSALLDDRPVVLVSAHYGNFELAGYTLGILGFPTYTVARALDNPYLDRFVNRFRSGTGQRIVRKKGGYDEILDVLARGGTMTFLADQYAGTKSCWVEFFGRPASVHKAIALLALDNNARVAVGHARRIGGPLHYLLAVDAVVDPAAERDTLGTVPELTQWYTRELEGAIRQAPQQYWWLHRRWKDHRGRKSARRKAARRSQAA